MRTEEQVLIAMFEALIPWYEAHKRELPWRQDREPYHVWLSEIMLQQTRVEAVKEYYRRFVTALPTIPDLAEAPEEQILKLWEGLGYYNRVRNLQKAAQTICAEYTGVFHRNTHRSGVYPVLATTQQAQSRRSALMHRHRRWMEMYCACIAGFWRMTQTLICRQRRSASRENCRRRIRRRIRESRRRH